MTSTPSPMYPQILVGDYGLSPDQQRIQVALWSMMASPLLISADVRDKTRSEFKELLMNPRVLAISQDPLGIMGKRVMVVSETLYHAALDILVVKGYISHQHILVVYA